MDIKEWFSSLPGRYHIIVGLLLTAVIGYVDYVTGYELRMELLYLMPISYVTWFVGQRAGIMFSFLSMITTVYSDIMAGKKFTHFTIEIWNGLMYLVFYVIVTLLLKLQISLQQRENLLEELDNALMQNEELRRLLPVCSRCKKLRDDEEYRQKVESYIGQYSKAEFSHGLCTECAAKTGPTSAPNKKKASPDKR